MLEYVPETVYRIAKHYNKMHQRMPLLYVKLYTYQICRALAYIHNGIGVCHRDIKPQNLLVSRSLAASTFTNGFWIRSALTLVWKSVRYCCWRLYRTLHRCSGQC